MQSYQAGFKQVLRSSLISITKIAKIILKRTKVPKKHTKSPFKKEKESAKKGTMTLLNKKKKLKHNSLMKNIFYIYVQFSFALYIYICM